MTLEDWWLAGLVTATSQAVLRSIEVECHPQGVSRVSTAIGFSPWADVGFPAYGRENSPGVAMVFPGGVR